MFQRGRRKNRVLSHSSPGRRRLPCGMSGLPDGAGPAAYLQKAEECARLAGEAADPVVREAFENAARGWRLLAAQNAPAGEV